MLTLTTRRPLCLSCLSVSSAGLSVSCRSLSDDENLARLVTHVRGHAVFSGHSGFKVSTPCVYLSPSALWGKTWGHLRPLEGVMTLYSVTVCPQVSNPYMSPFLSLMLSNLTVAMHSFSIFITPMGVSVDLPSF